MKRRDFLKASAAISALAGLNPVVQQASAAEPTASAEREFYELRLYRLKEGADPAPLLKYLGDAAIPALNRLGLNPIGVFTEIEPKDGPGVYVLIPYPNLESFAAAPGKLEADPEYLKAGAEYLQSPKSNPAFLRIDSWLMRAFAGLPRLSLPSYCKDRKPRIFEMRTYESHSESKAQNKVDMFNAGEIETMKEVGLGPIFYGQSLIGRDLPHLIYMTSGENRELHKQHWAAFGQHPTWKKQIADKQYVNNVSKNTSRFLQPVACSQI